MGKLYRFLEPLLLQQLRQNRSAHGYELLDSLNAHSMTDAAIDKAALYRTLRQLEEQGYVESEWEDGTRGPARRVYRITRRGEHHLRQWAIVMEQMARSMMQFTRTVHRGLKGKGKAAPRRSRSGESPSRTPARPGSKRGNA